MTNVPLIFQPLVKYVEFNGRSRRSEFWLWVLFRFIFESAIGAIAIFMIGSSLHLAETQPEMIASRYLTIMPLFQLLGLALFLPSLAVGVRRLHDTNRSGWWIILPIGVTVAGFILFFIVVGASLFQTISANGTGNSMTEAQSLQMVMSFFGSLFLCVILPYLIASIVMLVFFVTDGTAGPNRFGQDPKGRGNAAVF
jgi:uncharacterized membrane protein YhaH (DUF805 family)